MLTLGPEDKEEVNELDTENERATWNLQEEKINFLRKSWDKKSKTNEVLEHIGHTNNL